jgi:hypothetical protein
VYIIPFHSSLKSGDDKHFTIMAWVTISSSMDGLGAIFSTATGGDAANNGHMLVYANSASNFRGYIRNDYEQWISVDSTTVPTPGVWYHVVFTYNGAKLRMWVNGVNEANTSHTRPINELSNDRTIGQYLGDRWEGHIDEFIYFNSTITDQEIIDYYNYTKTFYEASFDVNNLANNDYIWNCEGYDNDSNSDWGNSNFTLTVGLGDVTDINYSVALPLGVIRFLNCSPDHENADSRPIGQTASIAAINATNNGSATADFTINLTGALNTGWTIWASNDSLANNITLSTSAQTIWESVAVDETKKIWLAANCSYVSANPGQSITMWAV